MSGEAKNMEKVRSLKQPFFPLAQLIPTPLHTFFFFFNDGPRVIPPGSLPRLSRPQAGLGGCPLCSNIASFVSLKQHTDGAHSSPEE